MKQMHMLATSELYMWLQSIIRKVGIGGGGGEGDSDSYLPPPNESVGPLFRYKIWVKGPGPLKYRSIKRI